MALGTNGTSKPTLNGNPKHVEKAESQGTNVLSGRIFSRFSIQFPHIVVRPGTPRRADFLTLWPCCFPMFSLARFVGPCLFTMFWLARPFWQVFPYFLAGIISRSIFLSCPMVFLCSVFLSHLYHVYIYMHLLFSFSCDSLQILFFSSLARLPKHRTTLDLKMGTHEDARTTSQEKIG